VYYKKKNISKTNEESEEEKNRSMLASVIQSLPGAEHSLVKTVVTRPTIALDTMECPRCHSRLRLCIDSMQDVCTFCNYSTVHVDASLAPGLSLDASTTQTHKQHSLRLSHFLDLVSSVESRKICRPSVKVLRKVSRYIIKTHSVCQRSDIALDMVFDALQTLGKTDAEISKVKTATVSVFCALTGTNHKVLGSETAKRLRSGFLQFEEGYTARNIKCYRTVLKTICERMNIHLDGLTLMKVNPVFEAALMLQLSTPAKQTEEE
jgi:hypothetical protein